MGISSSTVLTADVAVVGGGVAGSSVAAVLASAGLGVVLVEREARFRDRVRGESIHPWWLPSSRCSVSATSSAEPDQRHLASVTHGRLFATPYQSPQPPLWEWGVEDWLMVLRVPPYHARRQRSVDPSW